MFSFGDFLSLFSFGMSHAQRSEERKLEAARLNAAVAATTRGAIQIIDLERSRLVARCRTICPDAPELVESIDDVMMKLRAQAEAIIQQTEEFKVTISAAGAGFDWGPVLVSLIEWQKNSENMTPYVEGLVKRYDEVLNQYG